MISAYPEMAGLVPKLHFQPGSELLLMIRRVCIPTWEGGSEAIVI